MLDVLTDVVDATRTTGVVFAHVRFRVPWGLACEAAPVAGFHVVASGSCLLVLESGEQVRLGSGDIALVPHGHGHVLTDRPGSPVTPLSELMGDAEAGELRSFRLGGDGGETVLVCGGYLFDARGGPHPLLELLPPVMHLESGALDEATRSLVRVLAGEAAGPGPGSATVMNRVADALLIHVVRAWAATRDGRELGWLAGLRDPAIGAAIRTIHTEHRHPLPVEELAARVSLSPATFKRRFRDLVGSPPGAYLTRVRLDQAARLLRDTDDPVSTIARAVGYSTEPAFSRAFSRRHGLAPGRWRAELRAAPPASPFAVTHHGR
ncbi:AraC family transcriptional regulator [Nocardioides coralli]|uniref:AraC family transcriptional regulator n=1 Tax=Nocardioides coralli TaxID=2872154 RepID=UPI001CA4321E|nr:AraC family transcriptional regulator [Nocardioides coralli]QZY29433.1 AraC family transcriptional regulator [Nocardioides coralli]